jgi:hypothetical protein
MGIKVRQHTKGDINMRESGICSKAYHTLNTQPSEARVRGRSARAATVLTALISGWLIALLASWVLAEETTYEVWRSTLDDPSCAQRIGAWLTSTAFEDQPPVSGQPYYYWVKGITSNTVSVSLGRFDISYILELQIPTAHKRGSTSPVRSRATLEYEQAGAFDGNVLYELREEDIPALVSSLLDQWTQPTGLLSTWAPRTLPWITRDVDLGKGEITSNSEVFLQAKVYDQSSAFWTFPTVTRSVALRDTYDPAPTNVTATRSGGKIAVSWNPSSGNTSHSAPACVSSLQPALLPPEHFDTYPVGAPPSGGWSDRYEGGISRQEAASRGVTITVDDTVRVANYGRSVHFLDTSTNTGSWMDHSITPSDKAVMEYYMLSHSTDYEGAFVVLLQNDVGTDYAASFRPDGYIGIHGWLGGWKEPHLLQYKPDTWYYFRREVNLLDKTGLFYVEEVGNPSNNNSYSIQSNYDLPIFDTVRIVTPTGQGADTYIDGLTIITPEPATLSLLALGVLALFRGRRSASS